MKRLRTYGNHKCAPGDWKRTPDMTGSHELDAVIIKTSNKDMADRLESHLMTDVAYKRNSGYGSSSID